MQAQTISKTDNEMETKAVVAKLPYILTSVVSEALVDTVVVTLTKVKAETLGNSRRVGS